MSPAERVYRILCSVPRGTVVTYADLARAAGIENGQRAVGRMMAANPYPAIVPCHRVVRSDGRIGGYAFGAESKAAMLRKEGVEVGADGRVAGFGVGGAARFRPDAAAGGGKKKKMRRGRSGGSVGERSRRTGRHRS